MNQSTVNSIQVGLTANCNTGSINTITDGETEDLKRFQELAQYHRAECVREGFPEEGVLELLFSKEGNFVPQGTSDNAWRRFWLSKTN